MMLLSYIVLFAAAYLIKGGLLDQFGKWIPSGKLISTLMIALFFALVMNPTAGVFFALAWLYGIYRPLGTYVQAIEGRDPRTWDVDGDGVQEFREGVDWIDEALMPVLDKGYVKSWGWLGLALRGGITVLGFVFLLQSFLPLLIGVTMPVWYWLSWQTHKITRISTAKFWFAELYYGAALGLGVWLGGLIGRGFMWI